MAALDQAKAVAAHWQWEWGVATTVLDTATAGVTAARGEWSRVSTPAFREPVTKEDTVALIAQLPALVRAGDALADSAAKLQDAATRVRVVGDTTIEKTNAVVAVQDTLIRVVQYRPRLSLAVEALYDPIAHVPAAALVALVRVTDRVSFGGRAEQRFAPGEPPRGYVVGRFTL